MSRRKASSGIRVGASDLLQSSPRVTESPWDTGNFESGKITYKKSEYMVYRRPPIEPFTYLSLSSYWLVEIIKLPDTSFSGNSSNFFD